MRSPITRIMQDQIKLVIVSLVIMCTVFQSSGRQRATCESIFVLPTALFWVTLCFLHSKGQYARCTDAASRLR